MTDREYEMQSYAAWIVSTFAALEILRRNNASGHAQQLEYVLHKFFKIAKDRFGDDFLEQFHSLFEETNGPIAKDQDGKSVNKETIH